MLIGPVKEPAKIPLNAQGVEVVPTHAISPDGERQHADGCESGALPQHASREH